MNHNFNNDISDEDFCKMISELDPPHGLISPICEVMRMKKMIDKYKAYNDPSSLGYEQKLRKLINELDKLKKIRSELMNKYDYVAKLLVDRKPITVNISEVDYTFRTYLQGNLHFRERYIIFQRENTDSWYILLRFESQLEENLFVPFR